MKLSVPTNFQKDLFERIDRTEIIEVYGKLQKDIIGGGRSSAYLPYISTSAMQECVKSVHRYGLKFNYLLNSLCLGNLEWTSKGQKKIRKLLDWLAEINVDSVTVSLPYMLQMIKKCYPMFDVNISINTEVNSVMKAKTWEDLGADQITLSLNVNRDFKMLTQIRRNVKCRLQLIANLMCLSSYPFCNSHYISTSHNSQNGNNSKCSLYLNYYPLLCRYLSILEPNRLISAGWIRPEDLQEYEGIGIDRIKLADRRMKTELIVRVVSAYTTRQYKGNLFDLLFYRTTHKNSQLSSSYFSKAIHFLSSLWDANLFKIYREMAYLQTNDPIYLNNQKLEGFISFFRESKCNQSNCKECLYCHRIAEKSLSIPEDYKTRMLKIYKDILEHFDDGSLFYIKNGIRSCGEKIEAG